MVTLVHALTHLYSAVEICLQRCRVVGVNTPRPRLRDVAELAGVSEKTVSNVVNGYPYISEATRSKVEAALAELNYRVNLSARSMASGRTGFIALAVPGLDNPYFAELAGHVFRAAAEQRWTVLIEQTGGQSATESDIVHSMQYLVDGMVLHPEALSPNELARHAADTPIVLIGEEDPGTSDGGEPSPKVTDSIVGDSVQAARELTEHLLQSGRRRIAVLGLGADSDLSTSRYRFEGYSQALRAAGLRVLPELVLPLERLGRGDGAAAASTVLALPERPDAVICFNDVVAIGLLGGLHAAGIRVPQQIAVAGFDDIDEAGFSVPPLTTIAWDKRTIAETAIRLLAERQAGDTSPPREIAVPFVLRVRGSTGS
jgi:DNA-binding LacI/PurR family transcriptional regulator